MATTLVEELIEEILIRISPDEPAHLVSTALVSKAWRRIMCDDGFRRRYRKFHRTPPLLGYIQNQNSEAVRAHAHFIPNTSRTSPISMAALTRMLDGSNWAAIDCCHGRVLIYIVCRHPGDQIQRLLVWNPITGGQHHLSVPPYLNSASDSNCTGSVLCTANGCDHLDCSSGPFAVVFVWTQMYDTGMRTSASIYSSENAAWSSPSSLNISCDFMIPGVLIRDALYFSSVSPGLRILKYNLYNHVLSIIAAPHVTTTTLVMEGDDQRLQLVTLSDDNSIDMWSSQQDSNGICGWVKHKSMELPPLEHGSVIGEVIGFVEGTDMIFLSMTCDGTFTLSLKSRQMKKVYEGTLYSILPFMSFYTPR